MAQKLVTCLHCSNVVDAATLTDGPSYVCHGGGRWCPNPGCHGPLDRKAVKFLSFAVGNAVGGGDQARESMLERVGAFEDEHLSEEDDAQGEGEGEKSNEPEKAPAPKPAKAKRPAPKPAKAKR